MRSATTTWRDARRLLERDIDDVFEWESLAATPAGVGRDDRDALGIVDRSTIESAEKPPKITECAAPIRAQASMRDR